MAIYSKKYTGTYYDPNDKHFYKYFSLNFSGVILSTTVLIFNILLFFYINLTPFSPSSDKINDSYTSLK